MRTSVTSDKIDPIEFSSSSLDSVLSEKLKSFFLEIYSKNFIKIIKNVNLCATPKTHFRRQNFSKINLL